MKLGFQNFWQRITPTGIFRGLLFAALVATFVMMATGSAVRASDAATACPDWPTCFGQWGLPQGQAAQTQVFHRVLAAVAALLVFAVAGLAGRLGQTTRRVRAMLNTAALLMLAQLFLGGGLVLGGA